MEDFDNQLGRAVLKAAARMRDDRNPIGAMARSVLDGEVQLRDAAELPLFRETLGDAIQSGRAEVGKRASGDPTVIALTRKMREADERRPPQ
jgi:hypothetical protein